MSEELYREFLNEAAAQFTGKLKNKQVSERFKNRCADQFNRALNALRVQESDVSMRQNHEEELNPSKWATPPQDIMDAELTIVDLAVSSPDEHLIRVLPGKVYWSLLIRKLGLSRDAYIGLIVDALVANDSSPLSSLRDKLREVMDEFMPACQQGASADPPSAGG